KAPILHHWRCRPRNSSRAAPLPRNALRAAHLRLAGFSFLIPQQKLYQAPHEKTMNLARPYNHGNCRIFHNPFRKIPQVGCSTGLKSAFYRGTLIARKINLEGSFKMERNTATNAFRLGSLFGVTIAVHFTWFVIFALITISMTATFAASFPE